MVAAFLPVSPGPGRYASARWACEVTRGACQVTRGACQVARGGGEVVRGSPALAGSADCRSGGAYPRSVTDERAVLRPPAAAAAATGPVSNAIIRVTRLHRARAQQLLREVGLHPGQELLLMHLWEAGPQRQTELMKVFDADSGSMTRSVQRLERAGLVSRGADPTDGRATRVQTTEAGRRLRERIEALWADLESITTAGMSAGQRTELLDRLAQAEQNLMAGRLVAG